MKNKYFKGLLAFGISLSIILQALPSLAFDYVSDVIPVNSVVYADENSYEQCKNYIASSLYNGELDINVYNYNISCEDIGYLVEEVLNDYSDLYYISSEFGYSSFSNRVYEICLSRLMTDSEIAQVETRVSSILSGVNSNWSDFDKALYIHDYIVLNTVYPHNELENDTLDTIDHVYDIYGCLINGICVCEGYARSYMYLMNRLGIPCFLVSSDSMCHMWNYVNIDGSWYHVDCTFDDPTEDRQGRCYHDYFLKSDEEMLYNREHEGWNVRFNCSNTMYDNCWVNDVISPVFFRGDERFYEIYNYYNTQVIRSMSGLESIFFSIDTVDVLVNNSYYSFYPVYMTYYGDSLYYYDACNVYEYNLEKEEINIIHTSDSVDNSILEFYITPWGEARIRYSSMAPATYMVIDVGITNTPPIVPITPAPITPNPDIPEPTETPDYSAKVLGHSIILGGKVGVNFGFEISDDVIYSRDSYVKFTWGDGNESNVMLSDIEKNDGIYNAVCYVNAKEMTDVIYAQVIVPYLWSSEIYTYSVAQYAWDLEMFSQDNQSYDYEKRLVQALLTYGSYAQEYFDYNVYNVPLDIEDRCDLSIVDVVGFDRYEPYCAVQGNQVQFIGATLTLLSDTNMRLYFALPEGISSTSVAITIGLNTYFLSEQGEYYYFDYNGMVAGDLADIYTFYVYLDGSLDSTITYSPMVYFYNVVSGNNYPQELVNLVKSMYIYAATYDGYFG